MQNAEALLLRNLMFDEVRCFVADESDRRFAIIPFWFSRNFLG